MAELSVIIASHNFTVTRLSPRGKQAVEAFAKKYVQWGWQRSGVRDYIHAALKVFAAATQDRAEFRFHINQLKEFYAHLDMLNLKGDLIEVSQIPIPTPVKVKLQIQPSWGDREWQPPVIEYITSDKGPRQKFVDLQTGKGKSYCTMRGMEIFGYRTLIIVKPMYLEKWVEDMQRTMVLEPKDVMVIRGATQLMALLMMAEAGELESKIILLSNKTLQNWLKLYEKFRMDTLDQGYVCTPDRMCEVLGVGFRVIDEVHQDFHLNFKIDLYTNVAESTSLSATLLSDDDFMNKMYEIAYPAFSRYKGPAYDKYIAARAVIYRLRQPNEMRCKDPVSKNYSHHVYEQWILKNEQRSANYFDLINTVFKGSYLANYKKPNRCIIFCASIAMCTVVTAYLQKRYPHLDVRRYVEEDPWDNLMEADVSVTTLQSAGTAVDIPDLTTVILTTAVSSSQSNVQGFGRLRKLSNGIVPEFNYFVCEDVPKHVDYHEKKRGILQDRAVSYKSISIGVPV